MNHLKAFAKARLPFLVPLYRKMRAKSVRRVFTEVYRERKWGDEESVSGPGSGLEETQAVRSALPALLEELDCRSLLDVPCGDFFWMKMLDLDISYIGADIVADLIKSNNRLYGNGRRRFIRLDLVRDRLPRAQMVLCRDCLIHLSFKHAFRALENIRTSGATYLLASTYVSRGANADIETGGWRPINLQVPPFNLPAPMMLIDERCPLEGYRDKSLGLWRTADIPKFV